ncbi:MAG: GlsB/YeaQ/YmgE family stress response membrane protein [Filomicrobium sp.]
MEDISAYLQNPFVIMAITGLIAGWLASVLLGGGGLFRNLFVGVLGAIVGGTLVQMGLLQLPTQITDVTNSIPFGTQILVSTIGAIIVVIIARIVAG